MALCQDLTRDLDYVKNYHIRSILVNKNFQTWLLIGWQQATKIRNYVNKFLLTNMDFVSWDLS